MSLIESGNETDSRVADMDFEVTCNDSGTVPITYAQLSHGGTKKRQDTDSQPIPKPVVVVNAGRYCKVIVRLQLESR
jgi:2',3'-cyclic-nucleotide 2'-phosphodiesterase (5'-nucleotidase family)